MIIAQCAVWIAIGTSAAAAATAYYVKPLATIMLDGAIRPGDLEEIEAAYVQSGRSATSLYLNSPGGDFAEGIKIGYWLRDHKVAAYAASLCDSSCAFAWLGGVKRYATLGAVMIHMPFYRTSTVTVAVSRAGIVDAIWYLATLRCSRKLADALLTVSSTESDELFPITGADSAGFDLDYAGYVDARYAAYLKTLRAAATLRNWDR